VAPAPEPAAAEPEPVAAEPEPEPVAVEGETNGSERHEPLGVSAPASTTLTDGVYDEIRRLRSKVSER
jgi:hypothetical protein